MGGEGTPAHASDHIQEPQCTPAGTRALEDGVAATRIMNRLRRCLLLLPNSPKRWDFLHCSGWAGITLVFGPCVAACPVSDPSTAP